MSLFFSFLFFSFGLEILTFILKSSSYLYEVWADKLIELLAAAMADGVKND